MQARDQWIAAAERDEMVSSVLILPWTGGGYHALDVFLSEGQHRVSNLASGPPVMMNTGCLGCRGATSTTAHEDNQQDEKVVPPPPRGRGLAPGVCGQQGLP